MSVSTQPVASFPHQSVPQAYSSLAAATYLTWSAIIWTALLMEEQASTAAVVPTIHPQTMDKQLQIGAYSIGQDVDINLFGHPEIRY
ncbi:hypothetical protein MUN82_17455 [Hymenobacter aerilatus]|uniref:Uncharacterized protein n=1 Tax=Hymenobacter aerilatus TaxID=2932251 RepID=A0A8T9SVH6_9BACT|nr:hypothetical protein [Hymenobacter aerilatus]UOR04723.1 hypothetical protein MUN82_17455 [Hymenobacter aerilatus]